MSTKIEISVSCKERSPELREAGKAPRPVLGQRRPYVPQDTTMLKGQTVTKVTLCLDYAYSIFTSSLHYPYITLILSIHYPYINKRAALLGMQQLEVL